MNTDAPMDGGSEDVAEPGSLVWVALYSSELAWGGAEEGGWWFTESTLVSDPGLYERIGMLPQCFLTEAAAQATAARMREHLPALNEGRPELSSVLTWGRYDVLILHGDGPPRIVPERRPQYE